jgi:5-methylthioadenosine/S-adenosylhomocysteine deaminase
LRVEPNVTDELYQRVKTASERDGVIVQYHAAVNKDQVEWVRKKTGYTTIAYMNKIGVLKSNWLLTHMAVLTDDEVKMLKDNDTKLCHNPGATLHGAYGAISVGKFPEMIEQGITVGMGCDSSAANNSLDMFRTMYQVATSHKEFRLVPDLISPEKALEMGTIDGARAIAWDDEIGSLEKGKKADVIIVDMHRSNWIPIHDFSIVPNLVYSGEGADVETSIIDGRIVMEDRKILTMDVDSVLKRAQAAAADVISQLPYKIAPRWPIE